MYANTMVGKMNPDGTWDIEMLMQQGRGMVMTRVPAALLDLVSMATYSTQCPDWQDGDTPICSRTRLGLPCSCGGDRKKCDFDPEIKRNLKGTLHE